MRVAGSNPMPLTSRDCHGTETTVPDGPAAPLLQCGSRDVELMVTGTERR
jgi:hypothetical protein